MISLNSPWQQRLQNSAQQFVGKLERQAKHAQSEEGRLKLSTLALAALNGMVALVILLGGLLTGLIDSLIALPVFVIAVALLRNSSLSPSLKNHLLLGLTALACAAYCTVIHPSAGLSLLSLGLFSSTLVHKPKLTLLTGLAGAAIAATLYGSGTASTPFTWWLLSMAMVTVASAGFAWLLKQSQIGLNHDLQFVLANINMLTTDLSELNELANQLGKDNTFRMTEGVQTAEGLQTFIQTLKQQTTQAQQAADQSSQLTQDCFDLINELNQSLDLLTRMGKQSHEANRDIQFFAEQAHDKMPEATRHGLMAVAASLEHLNERMQAYMAKIDVLKRGLSALENDAVSLDRTAHHWIEEGHNNQRQGWTLLSNIEQLQTGAEDAYATLGSSVKTVLRVNKLIEDLDRRLRHIEL